MPTIASDALRRLAWNSLCAIGAGYVRDDDGTYLWHGDRPDKAWHVHGWTDAHPRVRIGGQLAQITVRKRRWLDPARGATCHSRPPDDLGMRFDAMLIALELWCWIDGALGLHRYMTPFDDGPSSRTVQRWMRRALPDALHTQQANRRALVERCEPQPMEDWFPRGLSPPGSLTCRRWRDHASVWTLWRGLAFLFFGASAFDIPAARLLAEARGRWTHPTSKFTL